MRTLAIALALALLLAGCGTRSLTYTDGSVSEEHGGRLVEGSGVRVVESREVGAFRRVRFEGALEGHVTAGPAATAEVEGDDNLAPLVRLDLDGETLRVWVDASYRTDRALGVRLTTPALDGVSARGICHVTAESVDSESFTIDGSGASRIVVSGRVGALAAQLGGTARAEVASGSGGALEADLSGASVLAAKGSYGAVTVDASGTAEVSVESVTGGPVEASLSGASRFRTAGAAERLEVSASGTSGADLSECDAGAAQVELSGASHADLGRVTELRCEASGASRVTYSGEPTKVVVESSGAASIRSR